MLQLRPSCECCDVELGPAAPNAVICTYECTWCSDCAQHCLDGVCPNCGGNFSPRPIRPVEKLVKDPATSERTYQPGLHRA